MNARRRIGALLEVLGVYLAGSLVTGLLCRVFSLQPSNPLATFKADISDAELITATIQLLEILALQYAGWFLLIIPLNAWRRRQGPRAYGLTCAGRSWKTLLLAGLATAALAEWPVLGLNVADHFFHLGETVPWRQALFDTSWRRWEFWLFTGVLSWGLVALCEELFFRGYCQQRLAEDWGDGAAIVGTTCLFAFAHSQYLLPNGYSIGMLISLLSMAIGLGVVFAWTRSIVPSVVAHAIINCPMTPLWQGVGLAVFLTGAIVAARRGGGIAKETFGRSTLVASVTLAVVGASWAIAGRRIESLEIVSAGMVVFAIGFHVVDRRSAATKRVV